MYTSSSSTRMRLYMWIQWRVALARHITAVRLVWSCVYICTDVPRGLSVQAVSGSFSGNLHPTPCIEWMQGKRGDPGCMAKAATLVLPSVHTVHVCIRVHHPLLSFDRCTGTHSVPSVSCRLSPATCVVPPCCVVREGSPLRHYRHPRGTALL